MRAKRAEKALVILSGDIKTPPLSLVARREIGYLIRKLQQGDSIEMPSSRPMPALGPRCHELRVRETSHNWRVIYRIDQDAILVLSLFSKKTRETPKRIIKEARRLLSAYDSND